MLEYKCPYCGQNSYAKNSKKSGKFGSWICVRNHTSKCKLNTKEYLICDQYGPFLIKDLRNKYRSYLLFFKDYPLSKLDPTTFNRRAKINSEISNWSKEDCINYIRKFYSTYNRPPSDRELQKSDILELKPPHNTYYDLFASLNNAIKAAGFSPNTHSGYGMKTFAKDGKEYSSKLEAEFVNKFLFQKHIFEYDKPYINNWRFDFYIPSKDLYIEVDGGLRPERIKEKIKYCSENNINLLVVNYNDIYKNRVEL